MHDLPRFLFVVVVGANNIIESHGTQATVVLELQEESGHYSFNLRRGPQNEGNIWCFKSSRWVNIR